MRPSHGTATILTTREERPVTAVIRKADASVQPPPQAMHVAGVTALVFTFNEEGRIRYFLEAVKKFGSTVIIDNYSTDRTLAVAGEYTDRLLQFKNAGYAEHPEVAKFALSQVDTEWVYWGRADEIPPRSLVEKLRALADAQTCDVVLVSRLNLLFGAPSASWGRDYQLLFFRKACVDMDRAGLFEHGAIRPGARTLKLPATREWSLWHFSSYDTSAYCNTNNRYSTIAARHIHDEQRSPLNRYSSSPERVKRILKSGVRRIRSVRWLAGPRLFVLPALRFIWHFFVRGGIRSGWIGLTTSYLMMMEQMLIELKVAELDRGLSLEKINRYYDDLKSRLVAGEIPPLSGL
jgi:glycosyltransferase involved in cell wall biosynthesis